MYKLIGHLDLEPTFYNILRVWVGLLKGKRAVYGLSNATFVVDQVFIYMWVCLWTLISLVYFESLPDCLHTVILS